MCQLVAHNRVSERVVRESPASETPEAVVKNEDAWVPLQTSWVKTSGDVPQNLRFNPISQYLFRVWEPLKLFICCAIWFFLFTISTKIYTVILFYKAHLYISSHFIFTIILWDIVIPILQISKLRLKTFKWLCQYPTFKQWPWDLKLDLWISNSTLFPSECAYSLYLFILRVSKMSPGECVCLVQGLNLP